MSHVTDFCEVFYDEVRIPLANVVGEHQRRLARRHVDAELRARHRLHGRPGGAGRHRRAAHRGGQGPHRPRRPPPRHRGRRDRPPPGHRPGRGGRPAGHDHRRHLPQRPHRRARPRGLDDPALPRRARTSGCTGSPPTSSVPTPCAPTPVDGGACGPARYLQSFAYTIGGGTTDIQRNIVGERVLGLPGSRTMDLLPTPEQDEIVSTVGRSSWAPSCRMARVRELHAERCAGRRRLWQRCAALGWFGLGLAEAARRRRLHLVEEALLFARDRAAPARRAVPGHRARRPRGLGTPARRHPRRERRVALADRGRRHRRPDGVSGTVRVTDHGGAELGMVVAPGGAALVELAASPSSRRHRRSTRRSRWRRGSPTGWRPSPTWTTTTTPSSPAARCWWRRWHGIAAATADQSTEYAQDRVQFGRPIGVNQAVKHPCADMAVRAEAAACRPSTPR